MQYTQDIIFLLLLFLTTSNKFLLSLQFWRDFCLFACLLTLFCVALRLYFHLFLESLLSRCILFAYQLESEVNLRDDIILFFLTKKRH